MSHALLRGRDHTLLGAVAGVGEGAAAIALSRGGARKPYDHVDPNEDVALFLAGPGGLLVAVADGHGGVEAAELAVELLADQALPWTEAADPGLEKRWEGAARETLSRAHEHILEARSRGAAASSRTTLAFAVHRPAERLLAWASIGDSHVFAVGESEATDLAFVGGRPSFLGQAEAPADELVGRARVGVVPSDRLLAAVLASDGLSERGIGVDAPSASVVEAAQRARLASGQACDRLALETARGLVETALHSHRSRRAGDNIATAVAWITARPAG